MMKLNSIGYTINIIELTSSVAICASYTRMHNMLTYVYATSGRTTRPNIHMEPVLMSRMRNMNG